MQAPDKTPSRKKFLLWSAVLLGSATVLKLVTGKETKKKESDTIKMLTEDGRLVEIDKNMLAAGSKKISDDEIKDWIKR